MKLWFALKQTNLDEFLGYKYLNYESLTELLDLCIREHLLNAIKLKTLYSPYHLNDNNLKNVINNNLEQLILELTGKCNLRCGYCIYVEYIISSLIYKYIRLLII